MDVKLSQEDHRAEVSYISCLILERASAIRLVEPERLAMPSCCMWSASTAKSPALEDVPAETS